MTSKVLSRPEYIYKYFLYEKDYILNLYELENDMTLSVILDCRLNNETGSSDLRTDSSDVMLPCEFCDNLFPADVIIQHQVNIQLLLKEKKNCTRNVSAY